MMKTDVQICRVCLIRENELNSQMNSIFGFDQGDNIKLSDKLSDCCGFKIENENHLPGHICNECLNTLIISYDFRKLCQKTEKKLRIQTDYLLDSIKLEVSNSKQHDEDNDDFLLNIGLTLGNDHENEELNDSTLTETIMLRENLSSPNIFKIIKNEIPTEKIPKISPVIKCLKLKTEDEKMFICEICGNFYYKRYQLRRHVEFHANIKPYECEICKKKFRQNNHLARHMRSHTGQKPHACKFCDRHFSDLSTKIKHERSHTDERPYKCDTCGKAFRVADTRNKHMTVHTGEKAFECELCGSRFSRRDHLRTHYKSLMHKTKLNEHKTKSIKPKIS